MFVKKMFSSFLREESMKMKMINSKMFKITTFEQTYVKNSFVAFPNDRYLSEDSECLSVNLDFYQKRIKLCFAKNGFDCSQDRYIFANSIRMDLECSFHYRSSM